MSAIILESGLAHYEALGRGKPLLFLHGWLGSWRYWVPTMMDMANAYRAYAMDFWGFGDSDKADDHYHIQDYTQQVLHFVDKMGIGQMPIVGHGLGAVVALHFAQAYPDRVEQVMTVSLPLQKEQVGRPLSLYTGMDNACKAILGRKLKAYQEVDLEAAKTDGHAVVQSVQSMHEIDLLELIEDLDIPVLMVAGREDPIVQMPSDAVLSDFDFNVYHYAFDNAQHYPMLDDSAKFNRLLREFLLHGDNWDAYDIKDQWKRRMR